MLPLRKSPMAASRANSPARLLSSSGSDGSLISNSTSGCFIHNQTTPRPATTPRTYDRVAHPEETARTLAHHTIAITGQERADMLALADLVDILARAHLTPLTRELVRGHHQSLPCQGQVTATSRISSRATPGGGAARTGCAPGRPPRRR